MSIFGNMMSAIFEHASSMVSAASANPPPNAANAPTPQPTAISGQAVSASKPQTAADVSAILDKLAQEAGEKLEWRKSIVDLMKLLHLDSGLSARQQLAKELNFKGNPSDSASMNIWLHKEVMTKLAENGGNVPDELKH